MQDECRSQATLANLANRGTQEAQVAFPALSLVQHANVRDDSDKLLRHDDACICDRLYENREVRALPHLGAGSYQACRFQRLGVTGEHLCCTGKQRFNRRADGLLLKRSQCLGKEVEILPLAVCA
ncbi:hypothetical protein D3C81_1894550 [compost metagenome]